MEAFTDSLAAQMAPLGVHGKRGRARQFRFRDRQECDETPGQGNRIADRSKYKKPDEVAAAVEQALFEATPKRRYMVVADQREGEITIRKQIEQLCSSPYCRQALR